MVIVPSPKPILDAIESIRANKLTARQRDDAFRLLLDYVAPTITVCCKRAASKGIDREDCQSTAGMMLLTAVEDYDATKSSFSSFYQLVFGRELINQTKQRWQQKHRALTTAVSLFHGPSDHRGGNPENKIGDLLPDPRSNQWRDELEARDDVAIHWPRMMERLSKLERKIAVCRYQDEMSYEEITRKLNVPLKAVDNALQRIEHKRVEIAQNKTPVANYVDDLQPIANGERRSKYRAKFPDRNRYQDNGDGTTTLTIKRRNGDPYTVKLDSADVDAVKRHWWMIDIAHASPRARSHDADYLLPFVFRLHHEIPRGKIVQTINGNMLDCRMANLTTSTRRPPPQTKAGSKRKIGERHADANGVNAMSILTNNDPAQQAADQVRQIARNQFAQLGMSGKTGFNLIWKNRNATPAEVLAALGTDAETIFALAQLNISTLENASQIAGATPPVIPSIPDGFALTFDSSGNGILESVESSSSASSESSGS